MARKPKGAVISTQPTGKFLLAKNLGESTRFYRKQGEIDEDLSLPAYQAVVIDPQWLDVPYFIRDITAKYVKTEWSDFVPDIVDLNVSDKWELSDLQKQVAGSIVRSKTLDGQMQDIIHLTRWIGENGLPLSGARTNVTVEYLKTSHRQFLQATIELEKRIRNRPEFIEFMTKELKAIDLLRV